MTDEDRATTATGLPVKARKCYACGSVLEPDEYDNLEWCPKCEPTDSRPTTATGLPVEAVEAAAEVLYDRQLMPDETPWHLTSDLDREEPREDAEAALTAAMPALREQWEREHG